MRELAVVMRQRFMLIGNVSIPMDGLQGSHLQRKSASRPNG